MKIQVSFDFVSFSSLAKAEEFSATLAQHGINTYRIEQDGDEWLVQPDVFYYDDPYAVLMCTAYGTTPGSDETDCFGGEPSHPAEALALMPEIAHLPLVIIEVTP